MECNLLSSAYSNLYKGMMMQKMMILGLCMTMSAPIWADGGLRHLDRMLVQAEKMRLQTNYHNSKNILLEVNQSEKNQTNFKEEPLKTQQVLSSTLVQEQQALSLNSEMSK